jgi:hypothetical protein
VLLATSHGSADTGDWATLSSKGLELKVPVPSRSLREPLLGRLLGIRTEIAHLLGTSNVPRITVYVAESSTDFRTLTRDRIPHWSTGVAYPQAMTMVLQHRDGDSAALLQTARHEFSHLLLHHAVSGHPSPRPIPVWFNEGVAMWVANEWRLQQSLSITIAALKDGLVRLGSVDSVLTFDAARAQLAYDESYLAVLFLLHLGGEGAVSNVLRDLQDGSPFEVVLYRTTGLSPGSFEADFAEYIGSRFGLGAALTSAEAIWFYIVVLVLIVWIAVRFRDRATLARWDAEGPLDALPLRLRAKIKREREL